MIFFIGGGPVVGVPLRSRSALNRSCLGTLLGGIHPYQVSVNALSFVFGLLAEVGASGHVDIDGAISVEIIPINVLNYFDLA